MEENTNLVRKCKMIAYFNILPVGIKSVSMGSYIALAIAQ